MSDYQSIEQGKRLKKFRQEMGLSQERMAEILEMTQGGYSGVERGRNYISSRALQIMGKSFNIDLNWLVIGDGVEEIEPTAIDDASMVNLDIRNIHSNQILSPVPANAGIPFEYSQEWLEGVKTVLIPGIAGRIIVFLIDGVSMMPGVEPGCYLGCRKVEQKEDITIGYIYIIVSRTGIWLKRLVEINASVHLESDNPDYPSFTVPFEDVRELYLPIVKITPYDPTIKSGAFMASYIDHLKHKG